jgi:uncharacterized glyoxalase superfamily protein PhnB
MCLNGQGSRGTIMPHFPGDDVTDGVWMSWWVESPAEVDALHASALAQGLTVTYPPTDEPWGVREFHSAIRMGICFGSARGLANH